MPRELSPFELDRELARVAPRARAAYRALRNGREVTLSVPDVLCDPETLERVATDTSDPIAAPLIRYLYWLELMRRGLPGEGERLRHYRSERHALDKPLSGRFTWRELLGHALRDAARRPALLDVLYARGGALRDTGARSFARRAELPSFAGRSRAKLELPNADIGALALRVLADTKDAYGSLELRSLSAVLELGLAPEAADGWPRQLSLRSLHDLLGSPDWLSGLRLDPGDLPASLSAASYLRGLLRLGASWSDALAPAEQPFSLAHDPFGLQRSTYGALLASVALTPAFLKRQLGLGKERALRHSRALARSALLFVRQLSLRVLLGEPALAGPMALSEAFSEHAAATFGFELPASAAGLFWRPRVGDAQRLSGVLMAGALAHRLAQEHDEDWYRNPRAIEQLRAEARVVPVATCSTEDLTAGALAVKGALVAKL